MPPKAEIPRSATIFLSESAPGTVAHAVRSAVAVKTLRAARRAWWRRFERKPYDLLQGLRPKCAHGEIITHCSRGDAGRLTVTDSAAGEILRRRRGLSIFQPARRAVVDAAERQRYGPVVLPSGDIGYKTTSSITSMPAHVQPQHRCGGTRSTDLSIGCSALRREEGQRVIATHSFTSFSRTGSVHREAWTGSSSMGGDAEAVQ